MNYRHQFHAGNFADVMKHMLLLELLRALQKKEKGFLYLDTHAGRGLYDLEAAAVGDTHARQAEWPDGVGRLLAAGPGIQPAAAAAYLEIVRRCDARAGNFGASPRYYPGSPWIARDVMRESDRLALCEKHPGECAALRQEFAGARRVSVQETDGYGALRSMLPPPERRGLILIDPPFEAQDEFAQIADALADGLKRFPTGVFAVWYPFTERARIDDFFDAIRALRPPPSLACELLIAGDHAALKMKGCGLLVINPPWQFDQSAGDILRALVRLLAQAPGGEARVDWVVREPRP